MELSSLLQGLLGELQAIASSESVAGRPMKFGDAHLLPLSRVSLGFGTGTTEARGSQSTSDGDVGAGGAAGGLVVEPRAFVVVGPDGIPHMLTMKHGSASLQRPVLLAEGAAAAAGRPPAEVAAKAASSAGVELPPAAEPSPG